MKEIKGAKELNKKVLWNRKKMTFPSTSVNNINIEMERLL